MNKRKFFILAVCFCTVLIGSTVSASANQRWSTIESRGIIDYDNGRVSVNAADLILLAEQMDDLEISFKEELADGLARIGTYIQEDGSIDHDNKSEDMDPQQIAYSALTTGILQSQSVAHLAGIQASDEKGSLCYAREPNSILEVTHENTGKPVFITAATEDNLASKTAAWVDGRCLVGTGADNFYFYQKGYIEGYAEKNGGTVEYTYDETGRMKSAKIIFL